MQKPQERRVYRVPEDLNKDQADCREQTGEWPEMRWERAYGKDAGLYPNRTGKPSEVFKQGTDMVRFVLYDHS